MTKSVLDNGVRIVTQRMPHLRSVSMGVWLNAGARDEAFHEHGLSHLIEHMIFKGTRKRSAYQIAKEFDAVGGQTNAFTTLENTCYHARVMDAHLGRMVDILSDILMNSVFDGREIERERPVILQEIGMVEDTPDEYVHLLSGRNFWGDHPLGRSILGTRESVLGFDADAVKAFFGRLYRPERIIVAAAGNLEHEAFLRLAAQEFEKIPLRGDGSDRTPPTATARVEIHSRQLEQAHLCLTLRGLAITDSRRYALSLLNTLLGGNMSSRLFQEIREKRGLAYAVYSFFSSYVDTGMFGVYAGVAPEDVVETLALVTAELRRLKQEPVDDQTLQEAKESTKAGFLLSSESNENQMVRIAQSEMHFGRYTPTREVLDRIDRVTAQQIGELARSLFGFDQPSLTVLGPIRDPEAIQEVLAA